MKLKLTSAEYEDYLTAVVEVRRYRQQAERLKAALEKEIRDGHEERSDLLRMNHDLAAQLAAAHAQLIAAGYEVTG